MCIKWNFQSLQILSGKVNLQEMDLKVVLGMFSDGTLEMCAFFSFHTFSVHFKLSRPSRTVSTFLNQLYSLSFFRSEYRVILSSDFTAFSNLLGFDTNIVGNS